MASFNVLLDSANVYPIDSSKRSKCIIVNEKSFLPHSNLPSRCGSHAEVSALENVFHALNFDVEIFVDRTTAQLTELLRYWGGYDYSDHNVFVLFMLSHGSDSYVYTTDGKISTNDLLAPFMANLTLVGKPKLFFVQAFQAGVRQLYSHDDDSMILIPTHADILIMSPCISGSVRREQTGDASFFLQSLCQALRQHCLQGRLDILNIVARVSREVVGLRLRTASDAAGGEFAQVPFVSSTLTKTLFLCKRSFSARETQL